MISGRSGLPKFRQLVAPIGSAPAHATFRAASTTARMRAAVRIEIAIAAVAIDRQRQRAIGALHAHDAGAHAGQDERVGAHHVIVLSIHPTLVRNGGRGEKRAQRIRRRTPTASRAARASALPRDMPASPSAVCTPARRRSARRSGFRRRRSRARARASTHRR